jgi:DNA-binding YbaB/EbfC family protein
MKNLADMLKQAQQLQGRMAEMQARLEAEEVTGVSGGGMVSVTLNGKGEMRRVAIDPALIKPEEQAVLQDLIVAAHRDAKSKVETVMAEQMSQVTGGLPLPPGFKMPF